MIISTSQIAKQSMHVIARRTLLEAARRHNDAHMPLEAWYRIVRKADWSTFTDVRKLWPSADVFGDCTIFNVKGNKYRLVVWINYRRKRVFIRHVMTHSEYSKGVLEK